MVQLAVMFDILRDSSFGTVLNYASNGRLLPFRDQKADYVVPARYLLAATPSTIADNDLGMECRSRTLSSTTRRESIDFGPKALEAGELALSDNAVPKKRAELADPSIIIVDWDGPEDPDNPK